MPSKEELQERLDKRTDQLDACRAKRTEYARTITDLRAKLAECRGEVPDPEPPPDPPPEPGGARSAWQPKNPDAAPDKGDFPSLERKNVGLLDAAILTARTGFNPAAGARYDNLDIRNSITPANGSSYYNCRITADGYWAVRASSGVKADFYDCELVGNPAGDAAMDCNGADMSFNRCYLHGSEDGAKLASGKLNDCLIIDNRSSLGDAHYDGLQSMSGHGIRVHHCYISIPAISGGTAAYIIKSDFGAIDDVLIDYCYLDGHSYTLDPCDGGHGNPTNLRVRYNRFGQAVFGAWSNRGFAFEKTGNVWDSDGSPCTTGGNQ